jgi:sigma-B regulation protein RsbU (phosphoserine phosphatase)
MRTFPADVNCLSSVLEFVRNKMKDAGITDDVMISLELAVEEVFVNIALYAYKGVTCGDVTIRCEAAPEIASLKFVDGGVPFNPFEIGEPDISAETEAREPGGLGFFMVKTIMDVIEYRHEEGKNVLCMSKNI